MCTGIRDEGTSPVFSPHNLGEKTGHGGEHSEALPDPSQLQSLHHKVVKDGSK